MFAAEPMFRGTMISVNVKACSACAKGKRRCTRQLPSCERCTRQRLNCTYPPAWRQSSPLYTTAQSSSPSPSDLFTHRQLETLFDDPCIIKDTGAIGIAVPSPPITPSPGLLPPGELLATSISPSLADVLSAWFLRPETWENVKLDTIPNRPIRPDMLEVFISTLHTWLVNWGKHGSSAFVHRQLYVSDIPAPICDVFPLLVSYTNRTSATEQMVFHILEKRITELVKCETQLSQGSGVDNISRQSQRDVRDHLSRVQALIAYSIIALFHGNIRLRHLAEKYLPLLVSWPQDMLQATARAASNGDLLYSELPNALAPSDSDGAPIIPLQHSLPAMWKQLADSEKESALWHTWVVAESVRRAWLTARSIETVYLLLRDRAGPCPGGLPFTMSKGLWDADSSFAWAKLCAESDVRFLNIGETDKLCAQPTSDAFDEFAKVVIKMNFRTERTSQWVGSGRDG